MLGIGLWLRSAGRSRRRRDNEARGLSAPVTVLRDDLGIPYIFAANMPDLLRAQGFVTAQHRLMQMELYRATWRGELAATFGAARCRATSGCACSASGATASAMRPSSTPARARTCSSTRTGSTPISARTRRIIRSSSGVAGLAPRPWSVADLVTLIHFVHYSHAANFKAEIVAQKLIDRLGLDRARELFPLPSNPDWARERDASQAASRAPDGRRSASIGTISPSAPETRNHQGLGSNNWAVGPSRTSSGKAMLANDPHLDNRILPGTWHPVGLFTPDIQAVGAALPGMPGILVGRTQHVAFGVTNAYGDVQDLYIETLDPADANRYLDGGRSVPFDVDHRDDPREGRRGGRRLREQALKMRYTRRGPVISDHPGLGPEGDKLVVLRSTDAEVLAPVTRHRRAA